MARRNRPSTIDRLPKSVRDKITQLRDSGRTIDEIVAALDKCLPPEELPSRSALGRHLKSQKEIVARMKESRAVVEAVARSFGDKPTSDVLRMNLELLNDLILRAQIGNDGDEDVSMKPQELMFLATALQKATQAGKTDFETQLKVELEKERRATKSEAADNAVSEARKQGLTPETVAAIKESILGVKI